MRAAALILALSACGDVSPREARDARIINALAEDNYVWAQREPELVALKLVKMQRGPYQWLRGTAGVFWRDITTPGGERTVMHFGDAASSRVLLVGDPHPENLGTFRAGDGTMLVDWNDFDGAGYGPFEGDVRRLAAAMIVAANDDADAADLAREVARGYASQIADLASGTPVAPVGVGAEPYLDDLLRKAKQRGDMHVAIDEVAPVLDGKREIAFGDLEPVADDGVIEDRLVPVGAEAAVWIDRAIDEWRATVRVNAGPILLRARHIGSGVTSYAALRYVVVLEGATASHADDLLVEVKEERDGLVIHGVPQLAAAEWTSPAQRVVDAQHRMHARRDSDILLGAADVGALALRIHDAGSYQRGVDADDIAKLDPLERAALARRIGAMLARAHGQTRTADGVPGWSVIAPLVGDGTAFADEIAVRAVADAAQIAEDWASLHDRDLAALVLPGTSN